MRLPCEKEASCRIMTKNERILLWYHEGIYPKFAIELVLYNKRNNEVFE